MYIFKAGVVGAGFMGAEIAQVISFSGLPVVVKDVDQTMLDNAEAHIREIFQGRVDKGKMSQAELLDKMDLIEFTLDYADFEDVDIVIEAVPEVMRIKQAVFKELGRGRPRRRDLCLQHVGPFHRGDGPKVGRPARQGRRHALLQPGARDEAGRDGPRPVLQRGQSCRPSCSSPRTCARYRWSSRNAPASWSTACWRPIWARRCRRCKKARPRPRRSTRPWSSSACPWGRSRCWTSWGSTSALHAGVYMASEYGARFASPQILQMLVDAGRLGEKTGAGFYGYEEQTDEPVKEMIAADPGQRHSPSATSRSSGWSSR